jgi:hypothetical protein
MNKENMNYIKNNNSNAKVIRTEILFTPLLIFAPLAIGLLLIYDWLARDFLTGELDLLGELMLGIIILICNIMFDIPFIKSLRELSKKK